MELKGIVSPEFLRLPLVFAKKRKLNTFLCVVRNSSSHQFRETFPMSYHRWKPIEVHCNDSAHSILQPSVCTSDMKDNTAFELAFGRHASRLKLVVFKNEDLVDLLLVELFWMRSTGFDSISTSTHSFPKRIFLFLPGPYGKLPFCLLWLQEFYALKRRCGGRDGNSLSCFCMVTVCFI
ncbi:hypothetical protein IFM89_029946 [Coptis chinensis]|uniref:Uncharacterized protein n=1 Tax=Coptis chinensis TaxID=261450 RepID=A0A835HF83_9MAGN|nr:hypothetical protein IFM89_029946 [Coptis chinensis]